VTRVLDGVPSINTPTLGELGSEGDKLGCLGQPSSSYYKESSVVAATSPTMLVNTSPVFVSDIAIFVLKRDVKLQLINLTSLVLKI